jgi:pimeloyl-ACP methyl ester carboxylesterase
MRWTLTLPLLLALGSTQGTPSPLLSPCTVPGFEGPALCGTHEVWEDREARAGRRIPLKIVVLPATGPDRAPDPVFVLAGGPGQAATGLIPKAASELAEVRRRRDVVFIDQRGTGGSNRLSCRVDEDEGYAGFGSSAGAGFIGRCRERLEKRADLRLYTTPLAVDDFDEVRATLGYGRVNLYGGSYGTRVGLVWLRRHPETVRSAVLVGVSPTDYRLPLFFARAGQDALDRLFADCAADPACRAAFPRVAEEFRAVLDRLAARPVLVELPEKEGRPAQPIELSRSSFAAQVHLLLFSARMSSRLPFLIHRMYLEDYEPFAEIVAEFGAAVVDLIDFGMQLSVVCAEDIPFITPEDVRVETAGTFLGAERVEPVIDTCRDWVRGRVPADYTAPVRSSVPALLISMELDPVTPPRFGEQAARHLSRSRHLVIPRASHLVDGACMDGIIARTIEQGTADGVDASCLEEIRRPPFVTSAEENLPPATSELPGRRAKD